uniref:Ig-like domain-containing protein n=1 Tax=Latimeria chalumnae TaxID=7897 RepID=H3A7D2_LATCH
MKIQKMISISYIVSIISLLIHASGGQITLNQSPASKSLSPGESITITCKASSGISSDRLHWYQQKSGQAPWLLLYKTSNCASWAPNRFSGRGSGTDYSLTITNVQVEDAGDYYCQQGNSFPFTVIYPNIKTIYS